MENDVMRDHNYFLDKEGFILKIVGDVHGDFVSGYVKYYPSPSGKKIFQGVTYAVNTDVHRSFEILAPFQRRIQYSYNHGTCTPGCRRDEIVRVFDQRAKIQEIVDNKERYQQTPVGKKLVSILELLCAEGICLSHIGVTGSFLTDMFDEQSDVDLTCYGSETRAQIANVVQKNTLFTPYSGPLFDQLYERRMRHMPSMSKEVVQIQEGRKIQALIGGTHVNVLPHQMEKPVIYPKYVDLGDTELIATVGKSDGGDFGPAFYRLEKVHILNGITSPEIQNNLVEAISFVSAYAQIAKPGERVYIKGNLLKAEIGERRYYSVSVDPWNRGKTNKIQLLRQ